MRNKPLRALTLWPEWAWAIHYLDKRNENRGWPIPLGEWFALHAGKSIGGRPGAMAEHEAIQAVGTMAYRAGWNVRSVGRAGDSWSVTFTHPLGGSTVMHDPRCTAEDANPVHISAILGLFRVTDHLRSSSDPWHVPGQIGNVFDYRPLREPIPCKGAQGLWTVPEDVAARVLDGVEVPRA